MRKMSWFYRLFFSYMPIFFIMTSFLFFMFFQILNHQGRKEAIQTNEYLLRQALGVINQSLKSIDQSIYVDLLYNPHMKQFYYEAEAKDILINRKMVDKINEMKMLHPLIDSIYFVRFKDNFVISESKMYRLQEYGDFPFINEYMTIERNRQWSNLRFFYEYYPKKGKYVVSLVREVPFLTGEKGLMVVNVSTEMLTKLVSPMYDKNVTFVRITDKTGHSLLENGGDKIAASSQTIIQAPTAEPGEAVSTLQSAFTGWTFESGFKEGRFANFLRLYDIWFIGAIATTVLGIAGIVYMTRKNYKPIERLVSRIYDFVPGKQGEAPYGSDNINEIVFIEKAIDDLIEQSNRFRRQTEEGMPLEKNRLFHELIDGSRLIGTDEWNAMLVRYGLPQPFVPTVVIVAEIDQYAAFVVRCGEHDQQLIKFALWKAFAETAQKHQGSAWLEWTSAHELSGMVQLSENGSESQRQLHKMAEEFRQWVQENMKLTVTIGIGTHAERIVDLRRSYKAASEALQFKCSLGDNRSIRYEDISSYAQRITYMHIPQIRAVVQSFRIGKREWTEEYDKLFEQMRMNVLSRSDAAHMMNYFVYAVDSEIANLAAEVQDFWARYALPRCNVLTDSFDTLDRMEGELKLLLAEVAGEMARITETRKAYKIMREVREYIELNYANPELSLDYISGRFDLNAKSFSKQFKKEFDHNFVDFLIDVRMEHAKARLLSTDDTVQEVAGHVGYTNPASFIRAFKKVVGSPPGDFRKQSEFGK